MYQIIEQTDEERRAIYMKLSKKELVAMLMVNQDIVKRITPIVSNPVTYPMPLQPPFNPSDLILTHDIN